MAQQRVGAGGWCALVAVGALALAACSSSPGSSSAASSTSPSSTSSPGATASAGVTSATSAGASSTAGAKPTGTATPTRAADQSPVLSSLPGSAKSGCVPVGDRMDVRSGTMAAGNFATARKDFADQVKTVPAPTVTLYLIPADARSLRKVTLTLEQVGGQHLKRSLTSTSVQEANQWKYFPVQVSVPAAGTWRLKATSGTSAGCFDVVFG